MSILRPYGSFRALRAAYETMPQAARAVFDRHRFLEMGYADIAWDLGIELDEVERRLAEAMAHLAREADKPGDRQLSRIGAWLGAKSTRIWRG